MLKLVTKLNREFREGFKRNLKSVTQVAIENMRLQTAHIVNSTNKETFKKTLTEEIMERENLRKNQKEKVEKIVERAL